MKLLYTHSLIVQVGELIAQHEREGLPPIEAIEVTEEEYRQINEEMWQVTLSDRDVQTDTLYGHPVRIAGRTTPCGSSCT